MPTQPLAQPALQFRTTIKIGAVQSVQKPDTPGLIDYAKRLWQSLSTTAHMLSHGGSRISLQNRIFPPSVLVLNQLALFRSDNGGEEIPERARVRESGTAFANHGSTCKRRLRNFWSPATRFSRSSGRAPNRSRLAYRLPTPWRRSASNAPSPPRRTPNAPVRCSRNSRPPPPDCAAAKLRR